MTNSPDGPRVYIMDMNSFDYTPAEAFGTLVLLKSDSFAPSGLDDGWNAAIIQNLRKQLLEYRPMVDYLIPTGKPLKMCIIAMLATERGRRHQYLAWDQLYYRYIPCAIDLTQIIGGVL